ncbi:uncharacterized protein G2W53_040562 [Senna tora]|uniref:Uncharacterized protein n=1 Tax=Senna tora TaxID=362788 RepID=A0A834SDL9_9FABA|nr:uncharacterized protein G2W53_040562 [Senna tora]
MNKKTIFSQGIIMKAEKFFQGISPVPMFFRSFFVPSPLGSLPLRFHCLRLSALVSVSHSLRLLWSPVVISLRLSLVFVSHSLRSLSSLPPTSLTLRLSTNSPTKAAGQSEAVQHSPPLFFPFDL